MKSQYFRKFYQLQINLQNLIMKSCFLASLFIFVIPSIKASEIEKNIENKIQMDKVFVKESNQSNLQSYKNNLNKSITFSLGTFVRGLWGPKYITSYCTVWELCYEKLEGINFGIIRTQELYKRSKVSFDIDKGLMLAYHNTELNAKNFRINNGDKIYANISFIPMIRIKRIFSKFPINMGYGAGFSYVVGKPKIEKPFDTPLLSEVKAEISYEINKEKRSEVVFALHHRCTFLGLLTPSDGQSFGQHWYTVGFRYGL